MSTADPTRDTTPETVGSAYAEILFPPPALPLTIEFGAASHTGKFRAINEDQYAVIRRRRTFDVLLSGLKPEEFSLPAGESYGMVVADGIGGARSGEVASRVALEAMLELTALATSWIMKLTDLETQQLRARVEAYVHRIQRALGEAAKDDPRRQGMGTTWTSAHLVPPHALIVHLGDSRAYLHRYGQLLPLTHDETLGQAFAAAGGDPAKAQKYHHVLINCLGTNGEGIVTQMHVADFQPGDQLLLCTDGLSNMVPDEEIEKELRRRQSPQTACDSLVRQALDAGGKDNVTVVLATASP